MASTSDPKDLGQLIFDENPYSSLQTTAPKKFELMVDETEVDYKGLEWYFKNGDNYVKKALRIPYIYKDANNHVIRDYLLIGYEGGGGD